MYVPVSMSRILLVDEVIVPATDGDAEDGDGDVYAVKQNFIDF